MVNDADFIDDPKLMTWEQKLAAGILYNAQEAFANRDYSNPCRYSDYVVIGDSFGYSVGAQTPAENPRNLPNEHQRHEAWCIHQEGL